MNQQLLTVSEQDEHHAPGTRLAFPVIGIGASAGGIHALLRFFENLPEKSGMAFVVVVHLSPNHESHVDQILRRATKMPTVQVNQTVPIRKDHVYVISPALDLQMRDGQLQVSVKQGHKNPPVVIDLFFRTLAEAHKGRAIAILLSGTGADGSIGMARIKEQGGITMAQLPEDAQFEGMPLSAIESNVVDFVIPVADMPQKLLELSHTAKAIEIPDAEALPVIAKPSITNERAAAAESALVDILKLLALRTGHDFSDYKRTTVLRRIERRMQVTGMTDIPMYLDYLSNNAEETAALLDDMLIGVTNFFRDREAFEALERDIVPELFSLAANDRTEGIRAWAAACSTGEEAYSLAMVLASEAHRQNSTMKVQVFGTDIDERAISVARRGLYPNAIVTDVPPTYLRLCFKRESGRYRISKSIRERVLFAAHNVLCDPPFSRLHLISCRNLLIYLDRRAQLQALRIFHAALRPGGYLFLGSSETADAASELFAPVDKRYRIYRSLPAADRSITHPPASGPGIALSPRSSMQWDEPDGKPTSYAALHQRALELHGPATILVRPSFRIVHMSEKAGRYLRHVGGEPSHNLLALIHPEMRLDLRTAATDALKTGRPVETGLLPMRHEGRDYDIRIVASPFNEKDVGQLLLLVFEEFDLPPVTLASSSNGAEAGTVAKLQSENKALRNQLQQTIEQSDTSTEELKASNEELQAVNEELRSATEELESVNEELESVNEELVTVNFELRSKVEETVKINDDLQNLISSSDIATIFVDRSMRVKWFTPRATTLFSLIPEDRNRPLTDITHRLDYPAMIADAKESFSSLRQLEREVRAADDHWYLTRIMPYRTAEDRIEGAVLNFVDITGRKRAEERLQEGLQRLRLVAESTKSFAIITTDPAGTITDWNAAAEILFGYNAAEAVGQPLDIIFTPEDRAKGIPAMELNTALERGHAEDERWHLRKDGSRFFCSGVVHPMIDNGLRGYAKIARDLTDKRIQDYETQSILERIKASNVLKDEFIAVMSHELRHPLNLIQLNMDLLSRTPGVLASPRAAKAIDAVRRSVRSQSQIIADLLDLSRVQTGKLKLECVAITLIPAIKTVLEAVAAQAKESRIALRSPGLDAPALKEITVRGDATRIEQIIWNLLNNALKFTPEGGTVTVSVTRENGEVRLDVHDTGIGIPAEALDRVFTMFGQVERQQSKLNQHGLGIGLALVQQLAKAHGGRVSATSEGEGKGATFSLWLPLAQEEAPRSDADSSKDGGRGALHDLKLLLVDDSNEVVETLSALCELEGATATIATSGQQALDLLADRDFDILVSDIGMPDMDGYELLMRLRSSSRNTHIPAIALSGYGHSVKAQAVGYTEQLCKPVSMTELLSRLQDLAKRAKP
jgi:two-component system CheB/CheR fusion protein